MAISDKPKTKTARKIIPSPFSKRESAPEAPFLNNTGEAKQGPNEDVLPEDTVEADNLMAQSPENLSPSDSASSDANPITDAPDGSQTSDPDKIENEDDPMVVAQNMVTDLTEDEKLALFTVLKAQLGKAAI